MYAKAIVGGKLIPFRSSPELVLTHCATSGKALIEEQLIEFVEPRRRPLSIIGTEPCERPEYHAMR